MHSALCLPLSLFYYDSTLRILVHYLFIINCEWFQYTNTTFLVLEMGLVAMADVDPNCKEFASLKLYVPEKYYIMEDTDIGSEVKHLVILPNSPFMATNVSNRADGSYASNDLWTPHPSKPGYWNICGRSDDTLIM